MDEKQEEMKEENKQLPIVANGRGLQLRNMDDMWRFACAVCKSGLAPKSFIQPEQVLIAMQTGAELRMPPMRSLQSFCVVNGQARLWGDAPLALVRQSGLMEYIRERVEGEGSNMVAICETKRKGDPEPVITEFSVEDAKLAGLWGKAGTWKSYPKRMLKYRARSFNLRDNFPDAFGGATIAEEYEGVDMPTAAVTPDAGSREERKQVDAKVTDTKEAVKEQLEICLTKFAACAESPVALDRSLDNVPGEILSQVFAKFATIVLKDDADYRDVESYTLENLAHLQAYLENEGIPPNVLALIPTTMTEEETTEHAENILRDYKWRCLVKKCGETFDVPSGTEAVPICPKCFSKKIEKLEPAEVKNE